ncbi:MAG: class I SAM-dependent methyltransferase [Planctomycetota bacterium]|nr:class I SAM-dependent methyltransferase [Planctomycetota bacterium]
MTSPSRITRTLEPEVMDSWAEAEEYDAMDHLVVNLRFAEDLAANQPVGNDLLDMGTGTALIPIELYKLLPKSTRIMAADASQPMLELARYRIEVAALTDRIQLLYGDCKKLPFENEFFDTVFSNTLIHHVPNPADVLREAWRVLRLNGLLFVRDLMRPLDNEQVEYIVEQHAANQAESGRQLLRQSLHASLTIEEIQSIANEVGITSVTIEQTSDRHWTLIARKQSLGVL